MKYYTGKGFNSRKEVPAKGIQKLNFRRNKGCSYGYEWKTLYVARNPDKPKENFVWKKYDNPLATLQVNAPNDYILKMQKEGKWTCRSCQSTSSCNCPKIPVGSVIERSTVLDAINALGLVRNQNRRDGSYFTLKYLKEICKALKLKNLASKSKEMLMDEIFEKMLKDAEQPDTERPGELMVVSKRNGLDSSAGEVFQKIGEDAELEKDYLKTIATISRIAGDHLYAPDNKPDCDTRTLENIYTLYKMKDPYDGLDDFLAEQESLND